MDRYKSILASRTELNNIVSKIKEPFEKETGIKLAYDPGGTGSDEAMTLLDSGQAEGAAIAVPFDDVIKLMKEKNFPLDPKNFRWRVIGGDRIQVLTNNGVAVKKLTNVQVKGLFSGKIKNWKELGGSDEAPVLLHTDKMFATQKYLEVRIMDGEKFRKDIKKVEDGAAMKAGVAATPGGFCAAPSGLGDKSNTQRESTNILLEL